MDAVRIPKVEKAMEGLKDPVKTKPFTGVKLAERRVRNRFLKHDVITPVFTCGLKD